jgi:glycosyltransferase involved in cell wall biosynthesis
MSFTVAVLTEDPSGPSARHRWDYPARFFREHGLAVSLHAVQPRGVRSAAFAAAAAADLVVIHRKLFRLPDLTRLIRKARRRPVYDLDDAVMYRPSGRRRQWSVLRAIRFSRTVRSCSLYLAGNRYLAVRAPRLVRVVDRPTPIDLDRYAPREEGSGRGRVVGWIGTAATLPYLLRITGVLRRLSRARPDLVLRVIGPVPPPVEGLTVDHVPWREESEAEALRSLDVGILPLPDDRWTRGKCAFKALQYMAASLPVVASPVGMNREVVEDGATGRLAESEDDWESALRSLLDDGEARAGMGRAGRRRVEERFAASVQTPRIARSLRSLLR